MEVINTDLAVIGGGTAGCMASYEARKLGLETVIIDKARLRRSGCLAPGVNAIYSYLHEGDDPEDYYEFVKFQGMGLARKDLALTLIRETRYAVSVLEDYGLPVLHERQGRFGMRIYGEHIKPILADIAVESAENIIERVYALELAVEGNEVHGVYVFDLRSEEVFFVRAKAVLIATGGASGLYRAYTVPWYPPSNAGTGYSLAIRAGAEMEGLEFRFIPPRIKDVNSPIGVTAVGFKAPLKNSEGEEFMKTRYEEFGGETAPIAIRAYAPSREYLEGRFPVYIDTRGLNDEQKEKLIKLYLNAWPMFYLFVVARGLDFSRDMLEVMPCEPYISGSHTVAGIWVDEGRMTSLSYLYAAGDAAGGVPLKHVGGALAEGIIAARSAGRVSRANDFRPQEINVEFGDYSWKDAEERMQFVLDHYAGGISRYYIYNEASARAALREIEHLLGLDIGGEAVRVFETRDRLVVARAMLHHMIERRETKMPPFQMRSDYPELSSSNYMLVSKYDGQGFAFRRDYV
ncbi:dissimilatory adenylylsulfate reductase alpha subunit precursor [Geoglobus ahangari]|uniref:Dissimilatory adenylylsulfate reductase alpha subunit n=1 Tax=Geoglobus ahangari TaxID=113653 RepID=A0A0F7DB88_9EURY|nr:FAD-binding protein [Geoglobus ahangari]AKG90666.1 dissimilatory adenylylsulfate reductase alpha subunit precursor [Geoglobus ahangari]